MVIRETDSVRLAKSKAREAIALAMDSRWQDAAEINRQLLEVQPEDLNAWNRLGKALLELGDREGARGAFARSLCLDPMNAIARKNMARLSEARAVEPQSVAPLAPRMFLGEGGKTASISLIGLAEPSERPIVSPGALVALRPMNDTVAVYSQSESYIGMVPLALGRRLACMMGGGNRYEGAVSGSSPHHVRVLLRETYQHPSQRSRVSFPASSPGSSAPAEAPADPRLPVIDAAPLWTDDEGGDAAASQGTVSVEAMIDDAFLDDVLRPELPTPDLHAWSYDLTLN